MRYPMLWLMCIAVTYGCANDRPQITERKLRDCTIANSRGAMTEEACRHHIYTEEMRFSSPTGLFFRPFR